MTKGVVVILEIVKIKIEKNVGGAFALRINDLGLFAESCTVRYTGQMIRDSGLFKLVVHFFDHKTAVDPSHHFTELAERKPRDHKIIAVKHNMTVDCSAFYSYQADKDILRTYLLHNGDTNYRQDRNIGEVLHDRGKVNEVPVSAI